MILHSPHPLYSLTNVATYQKRCMISGFCHETDENCALPRLLQSKQ